LTLLVLHFAKLAELSFVAKYDYVFIPGTGFALVLWLVYMTLNSVMPILARHKETREAIQRIEYLNHSEWLTLHEYLDKRSQTYWFFNSSIGPSSLCDKGLLRRVPNTAEDSGYSYTIPDVVWAHLMKHRDKYLETAKKHVK
jgi:hypothetical protein